MQELARRPQQASHGSGVLDLIRNALPFTLPFPSYKPSRPAARPAIPRINSSPSLQPGTSPGSSSSLPGSARGARTSRQRTRATRLHRTQTETVAATHSRRSNTPRAVTSPLSISGDFSTHLQKESNSVAASDASGNESDSESESDSQTFYGVARQKRGKGSGVHFQASLPAMQYCAFMIPPSHEEVLKQRAAEQRILQLRTRINQVLKESRDRLELAARVKHLQVRTQQV